MRAISATDNFLFSIYLASSKDSVTGLNLIPSTKTAVLKDYYDAQGNFYGVNGVGTIDEITQRLSEVFDKL